MISCGRRGYNMRSQSEHSYDQVSLDSGSPCIHPTCFYRRVCTDRQGSMRLIPKIAGWQMERPKASQNRKWKRERHVISRDDH
jgi:hypothetical protein